MGEEAIFRREKLIREKFSFLPEKIRKAVSDYRMINSGDRILVAVSGGKDSLSALHLLDYLRKEKNFSFHILACNVELGYGCANKEKLKQHFCRFNIEHVFAEKNIVKETKREEIDCFWCSWNRRKVLFETARQYHCNKVSLGHHFDDVVHTALMNLFFYGEISTSPPLIELFEGELTLIRPLCYIQEEETTRFARRLRFPLSCCSCPRKAGSRRTFVKEISSPLFTRYPFVKTNIFSAMRRERINRSRFLPDAHKEDKQCPN